MINKMQRANTLPRTDTPMSSATTNKPPRKTSQRRTGKVLQDNGTVQTAWDDFNAQRSIVAKADKTSKGLKKDVIMPAFGRCLAIRLPDGRTLEKGSRTIKAHERAEVTFDTVREVDE